MITKLIIKNFKSIKELNVECKRINIFIGEPNTGKSNILETIGLLCHVGHQSSIHDFVRFEAVSELFYDQIVDNEISIQTDEHELIGSYKIENMEIRLMEENVSQYRFEYNYAGSRTTSGGRTGYPDNYSMYKFYDFRHLDNFPSKNITSLYPPFGDNLNNIILTRNSVKEIVSDIITKFGYRLIIEQPERKIRFLKEQGDIFILFPYSLLSDTIQRQIFHLAAIHSNKDSIIAFNEPEAKAFPYYTKELAENIALDNKGNQYFISTHNPYFLTSILEKTQKDDINVNLTYIENYQTKIRILTDNQKRDILNNVMDPFFNITKYITKRRSRKRK